MIKECRDIFIYGCGGVGNELADLLSIKYPNQFSGFIDDNPNIQECFGFKVNSFNDVLQLYELKDIGVFISIGESPIREKLSKRLDEYGIKELTLDFSSYCGSNAQIGDGSLLHLSSIVSINTQIGRSTMINKSSIVGHDCIIGDYCVICPSVTFGGNVHMGDNCFVGTGAVIRNGISVGNNVIIGMGSVVTKDIEDNAVVVGNPAKYLRRNETGLVFKK